MSWFLVIPLHIINLPPLQFPPLLFLLPFLPLLPLSPHPLLIHLSHLPYLRLHLILLLLVLNVKALALQKVKPSRMLFGLGMID